MPKVGVATVRLLQRTSVEVVYPQQQTCCGQPFYNSGFWQEARRLAKHTIEVLEPFSAVVLPSGSCTAMIRHEYYRLLEGEEGWGARVKSLSEKTFELTEYLEGAAQLDFKKSEEVRTATYHDSCHMCRNLRITKPPRQLLDSAGYRIKEMEESDRCCGFGGVFSIRMPEASSAMAEEKIVQAKDSTASLMVTADPGCLMHMRGAQDRDTGIKIRHIAEVLEEAVR